ncbi:hypothetical protein QBC41DRAFT_330177 [Cercophora samala]|uniref:Uncharacterized protein n=1 Tax=Cercophora samala TaxID=330535 RepID=A0AA39YZW8_9PEZI|nr:hypothetical protein QBC41DRAFT_330177 [Cercophora samala]
MATTTATMNSHPQVPPLNWEYWDRTPVPLSLQIPRTPGPFAYQPQNKMPSKRFSIPRPLSARESSSSLSEIKSALKKEKMRHDNLPPLIIPRRNSSHKALLLQLQAVSVPGAVNLRKSSGHSQKRQSQKPQQPPYQNYQHERVYQAPPTPKPAQEPSSQRISSAQCPVIKPVPIPVPPIPPTSYPPNSSSTTRRLSQVLSRARSRSKSRDRRKLTKATVEPTPDTPFLASAPYGTGSKLNPGTPFLNDAPIVVEPDTPFLALRLEGTIPSFEDDDFLTVMAGKGGSMAQPPDSAMTMGSFLSQHRYPPVSNQQFFVQSPVGYHCDEEEEEEEEEDARARLPSQSPKKGFREWEQRERALKRSSAVYGGRPPPGGRLSRKDSLSPRLAGNGFSAGGGRPVSLPPWSKILPTGPRKSGEMDVAEVYAKMDPERVFGNNGGERGRGRGRGRERQRVAEVRREETVERVDSFSSAVSSETCVADDMDRRDEGGKSRVVSQQEPEQELVDEFGEREKAALRELLEYVDSILVPTENAPVRSGTRCTGGDWSREQSWWRDVRRSLQ